MTYSTPEVARVWSDDYMLKTWCEIERSVLLAQAEIGTALPVWVQRVLDTPPPTVEKWRERTTRTGHEVVAFLELWGDAGVEHVHIGLTSSDITDTTLGIRIAATNTLISNRLMRLADILRSMRDEFQYQPRLGRTHGQPAVPTTYGRLFGLWYDLITAAQTRLNTASNDAAVGKISGPVGTYLHVDKHVEESVCARLGLKTVTTATQIVPRDRLARWVAELGVTATLFEAMAVELRLLTHAQIGEVYLRGGSTSSAMPHKNNPNQLERLTGLARIVRAAYEPIVQGIVQWHERDMGHSSVERVLLPQAAGAVAYALETILQVVSELEVDSLRAANNLADYSTETQTHSIQTHFQSNGLSYVDAREATSDLYLSNPTQQTFRMAVNKHPLLIGYRTPTPPKEHFNEFL